MRPRLLALAVVIATCPTLAHAHGDMLEGGAWQPVFTLENNHSDERFGEHNLNLLAGGFSHHFKDRSGPREYNEVNNMLGLEYEYHLGGGWHVGAAAAYIRNSLDNDSAIISVLGKHKWALDEDWTISLGMAVGAQNGYPSRKDNRDKSDFLPVAYPMAEVQWKMLGVYGSCVPAAYSDSAFCLAGFKVQLYPW